MDDRTSRFLASARSCTLSPVEHAQIRASLAAAAAELSPSVFLEGTAESLRLTDYERAIGRSRLLSHMRSHPPEALRVSFKRFVSAVLSAAASVGLIGGGIAYAAEGSLPGDLLYPVKVRITEPVIAGLSLTSARRTEWTIRTIERRLEEATSLSLQDDPAEGQAILHSQMERDALDLRERLRMLPAQERRDSRERLLSELARRRESLLRIRSTTGVPPALRLIVEDAAEESESTDRDASSSSSRSRSSGARQSQRSNDEGVSIPGTVPFPALPPERSSAAVIRGKREENASSSDANTYDKRRDERRRQTRSLLRLLEDGDDAFPSSSSASSVSMFPPFPVPMPTLPPVRPDDPASSAFPRFEDRLRLPRPGIAPQPSGKAEKEDEPG